jgi:hypothetical protein
MHLRSMRHTLTDAPLEPLIKKSAHSLLRSHLIYFSLSLTLSACLCVLRSSYARLTNLSIPARPSPPPPPPHLVNIYVVEVSSISLCVCVCTLRSFFYRYITSLSALLLLRCVWTSALKDLIDWKDDRSHRLQSTPLIHPDLDSTSSPDSGLSHIRPCVETAIVLSGLSGLSGRSI